MSTKENILIGSNIRKFRKARKISMKKLGELVGLHESTISRYEQGDIKALDIDKIKEFAKVLNVEPEEILGWTESLETNENQRIWDENIGNPNFTPEELNELINFAKYLISKR